MLWPPIFYWPELSTAAPLKGWEMYLSCGLRNKRKQVSTCSCLCHSDCAKNTYQITFLWYSHIQVALEQHRLELWGPRISGLFSTLSVLGICGFPSADSTNPRWRRFSRVPSCGFLTVVSQQQILNPDENDGFHLCLVESHDAKRRL